MNETILALGQYALTGVILGGIIQYSKVWLETKKQKVLWAAALSILVGGILYAVNFLPGDWMVVIVGVWAAANTVYAVVFKGIFEK